MIEFKDIYVDVTTDSLSTILDENDIVICNDSTEQGTITNPIGFQEFREYLRIDHGDQNFYLKGSRNLSFQLSKDNLDTDIIFETPHNNRNIKITNWKNSNSTQEPWKLFVVPGTDKNYIACNGDNLEISNGDIEIYDAQLIFGYPVNDNNNDIIASYKGNLSIINCKLQTNVFCNYLVHSFTFLNFDEILIDYSILNVVCDLFESETGSILIDNHTNSSTSTTILNSILIRITDFVSHNNNFGIKNTLNVDYCAIFSYFNELNLEFENFLDLYYYLPVAPNNNKFNWSFGVVPPEMDTYLSASSQSASFSYYDEYWQVGIKGLKDSYGTTDYCHNTYRDGIGALTFPTLEKFRTVTYPLEGCSPGDIATITISAMTSAINYFDNNNITGMQLIVKNNGTEISTEYQANEYSIDFKPYITGNLELTTILSSYNNWYTKQATSYYQVRPTYNNTTFDFDFDIFVNKQYCSGTNILSAGSTVVSAFEPVVISAINNCTASTSPTIKSYKFDVDNNIDYNYEWYDSGNPNPAETDFNYSGNTTYKEYRYTYPGIKYVTMAVRYADDSVEYKTKRADILTEYSTTYYVNISQEYEDSLWWDQETILTDDFESGMLSANWHDNIVTSGSIKNFNDDNALSTDYDFINPKYPFNSQLIMLKNVISPEFSVEFSMVRIDRDSIPKFLFIDKDDNVLGRIEWDYIKDKFTVFDTQNTKYEMKYNLKDLGFLKDLRCPNSLRTLYFKMIADEKYVKLFYYKFKLNDDWKRFSLEDFDFPGRPLNFVLCANKYCGLGYIKIQSKCGLPVQTGTTTNPFPYKLFYKRVKSTGDYNDEYKLRGLRKVPEFTMSNKFFKINSWDASKYGNYVLIFDNQTENMDFSNSKVSNGIIYNIYDENYPGTQLLISNSYDMFITWNNGNILFSDIANINNVFRDNNSKDSRIFEVIRSRYNIYGSTIKTKDPTQFYIPAAYENNIS